MKCRIASIVLLMSAFLCGARVLRAQAPSKALIPEAPVLPMDIKFRYFPEYLEQSFTDDPRYARIVALVDHGRCDVILLDKTTNREAFYSSLDEKVQVLAASGADAYTTPIDFRASSTIDSYPLFLIRFHDRFGQEVTWQFVVGEMQPHASPEVVSRSDNSGITLMYAPRRAPAVAGTTLTIATRAYRPQSTPPSDPLGAFYATDITVGQIFPGTDLWRTQSSPADSAPTTTWNLSGDGGRQRILALKELSDTEAAVEQTDVNDPDAPQIMLEIDHANETYGLRAVSFKAHGNTLWIFFGPVLPLPAHEISDKTAVTFTVAENEQATVASGELEVQRTDDAEHVLWRFDTPNPAKNATFETGVNLISSSGEEATCVDVRYETPDCLEP